MRTLLALPAGARRALQPAPVGAEADGDDIPSMARPGPAHATAWIPADGDAVERAQEHVRAVLTGWEVDADTLHDADVLTADLVADLAARTRSRCIGVHLRATHRRVIVTIREHRFRDLDPARQRAPRSARTGPAALTDGLAVRSLDALAAEWGVSRRHRSTSVWFAVEPTGPLPLAAVEPTTYAQLAVLEDELHRAEMLLRLVADLAAAPDTAAVAAVLARVVREDVGAAEVDVVCSAPGTPPVSARHPREAPSGAGSMGGVAAVVPLAVDGQELGALAARWADGTVPGEATRDLLATAAGYAARALLRVTG